MKFKKFFNTPWFGLSLVIVVLGIVYGFYTTDKNEEEYVESLNMYERFIYNLEKAEKDEEYRIIKDLVEEHMIDKRTYGEFVENISTEDYIYMKNLYNQSIEELYINSEDSVNKLKKVLEQSNSDEILTSELDNFIKIQRDLLASELIEKLYTNELEQVLLKEAQDRIAWEKEWEQERKEEIIYEFMMAAYNQLTNYGDNYEPEIHDPIVAELASKEFGITEKQAGDIYIKFEWNKY